MISTMGKQVKTPRFYVDMPTFLHATGQLGWDDGAGGANLLYMNPSNPYIVNVEQSQSLTPFSIGHGNNNISKTSFPINFCALLNHNLGSNTHEFKVVGKHNYPWQTNTANSQEHLQPDTNGQILNANHSSQYLLPEYNGTTIFTFSDTDGVDEYWRSFSIFYDGDNYIDIGTHQLGSLVVGKYWDTPNSPDLELTMSRRFDGIKKQKTIGGKTLANIYYDGPTEWTMHNRYLAAAPSQVYKYPQFELDNPDAAVDGQGIIGEHSFNKRAKSGLGRKGLRSWNLTFSYISESNMWMDNEVSNTLTSDDVTPNDNIPNPMLADESFNFVWNCTLGGTLPFIFQPDNSETGNNPDRFAICTFRNNTLNVRQVAYNTYSLSITIDEVA